VGVVFFIFGGYVCYCGGDCVCYCVGLCLLLSFLFGCSNLIT